MRSRLTRSHTLWLCAGFATVFGFAVSGASAQHGSRMSITGASITGTVVEIGFVRVGSTPPSCTRTFDPGIGELGGAVRDGLIPAVGANCDVDPANATCIGSLIRDPASPSGIISSARCAYQCWVKNGSVWELVSGQTIDGLTFSKVVPAVAATFGRSTFGPYSLDAATTVNASLGVAELRGVAFVSSRGNNGGTAAPHSLTAIDLSNGAVLNIAQQSAMADSSAWGYRDGTSDGQSLMFGYEAGIEVIDPGSVLAGAGRVTNVTTVLADNGPQTIVNPINAGPTVTFHRGLAYNPSGNGGNGSLWTGDLGSDLWEIDLDGNVLTTHTLAGWSIYGLAWDHLNDTLWVSSAPANGPLAEIDPATGALTGRTIERFGATSVQGGLAWVAGGMDGRNCGGDLLAVDQAAPDTMSGYRLQLWDTLPFFDERALLLGVDGGGATPGDKTVRLGTNNSFEIDLGGPPGAAYSAFVNLDPAASVAQPVPSALGGFFPSLWELAVDVSTGSLINVTPLVSGVPVSLPIGGLSPGKVKLQAISLNFGLVGSGNPCGLSFAIELSDANCVTVEPPLTGCGVVASANGVNSFNAVTANGFWSISNQTGQGIAALRIDARSVAGTLRFDTDQTGMATRFDGGDSALAPTCDNTYRGNSDAVTGLVYAGTDPSPCDGGATTGWIGTDGAATLANDYQSLDFSFTGFDSGETFEFDCDTDGGLGFLGSAMAGVVFTVTLADGTVCSGTLVADPNDPLASSVAF